MDFNKKQQQEAKEALLDIIWGNLENDWKSYVQSVSEHLAEQWGVEEEAVYAEVREKLDVVIDCGYKSELVRGVTRMPLRPTWEGAY